jgi:putative CocE/NonD family hydrolase
MRTLLACALTLLATAGTAAAAPVTTQGYIPMDDGVTLAYQVMTPDPETFGPGPYPTVLDYSGYGPGRTVNYELDKHFVDRGYALAGVNIRGTGCSGGKFDYFEPRQSVDGKQAIEWLTAQPWSNGRLAMVNKSYPGITQLFVGAQRPKGLVAIVPAHVFGDLYRDVPFPGGIMNETFSAGWSLAVQPSGSAPQIPEGIAAGDQTCAANQLEHAENPRYNPFVQAFEHLYDDELFRERSPYEFADRIEVPTLLVGAWQDEQVGSRGVSLVERFAPDTDWRLLASNGTHGEYYTDSTFSVVKAFVDHYLRGDDNGFEDNPRVMVQWEKSDGVPAFSTGHDSYPPSDARVERLYLHADGALRSEKPAEPGAVSYAYTPGAGTHNQVWTTTPPDGTVAVFTTPPLERDLAWLGTGSVDLKLSSTAPDTDLEVLVSQVRPDGQEVYVQRGWLRASHRAEDPERSTAVRPYQTHLLDDVQPLTPGEVVDARVELFPTGQVFRRGSSLRISVEAPTLFSGLWGFAGLPVPAVNTIAIGESSIALPVIDGFEAPTPEPSCAALDNQPCRENALPVPAR